VVMSVCGVLVAIGLAVWQDGLSFAAIVALLPTAIAIPKYVFGRIEAGWGFVSRLTERGLRMRRGLANTRTDNIAAGRIQRVELYRPLLWRGPGWTGVSVTVAGIEDSDENGAENVLPVGTRDELRATLGHLAAPLGTADDTATIEHLLSGPARELDGLRTPVRAFWIARRTQVAVLLPAAIVQRSGILTRRLEIIPRERIQDLTVEDGPLAARLGVLDMRIGVAGETMLLSDLPRHDLLSLHAVLARDAATPPLPRPGPLAAAGLGVRRPCARRCGARHGGGPVTAPRLGIGVIGAGRVGAVLGAALRGEGHALTGAYAVSDASRERAAALLPGVPLLDVPSLVERSEMLLLAVPDDQLAPLAAGIAATGMVPGGQLVVHTSGRYGTEVLAPLAHAGSATLALHPAMTFTGTRADLARLIGCPMGITAAPDLLPVAAALAVELGGESVVIAEGDRPLYHAGLAHAANHLVVLVDQAREALSRLG